jgi:asparagine synthase (glutamine-hydrolysing)
MCGIGGIVGRRDAGIGIDRPSIERMRDRLAHRGPDDAGLYWGPDHADPDAALVHRRLSIIDPTPAGHQPMATEDGRFVLVYNGELYNDAELRPILAREGVRFRSSCDTETVLHAVSRWGTDACARLRGMYAFALWDRDTRRLLLARDGFGMKPVYWTRIGERIAFASEIPALLIHPGITARPDWASVSAYVSTVRTGFDDRTLFEGIRSLRPGEWLTIDASGEDLARASSFPTQPGAGTPADETLAQTVSGSIRAHLRSDVPWCSLLSGGLDSTILATIAAQAAGSLRTYVSGCPDAGDGLADDFAFAAEAASAIGTTHTAVPVDAAHFAEAWPEMIASLGVPLSTPNEVAIRAVARRLRADGHAVTLSGEGADELFAGYELPMMTAHAHVVTNPGGTDEDDGDAALNSAAWLRTDHKHLFVSPDLVRASDRDALLLRAYTTAFRSAREEAESAGETGATARLRAFLGVQRRVNLAGLLQRLDTSTMLESVEGRTPFADANVLRAANRLPLRELFEPGDPPATKTALRQAFAGRIPASIATRPKRSFPLPFQTWLATAAQHAASKPFLESVYTPETIAMTCAEPARHWNLAWPMFNLAIWSESHF